MFLRNASGVILILIGGISTNVLFGCGNRFCKVSARFCIGFARFMQDFREGLARVLQGFCKSFARSLQWFCKGGARGKGLARGLALSDLFNDPKWVDQNLRVPFSWSPP